MEVAGVYELEVETLFVFELVWNVQTTSFPLIPPGKVEPPLEEDVP